MNTITSIEGIKLHFHLHLGAWVMQKNGAETDVSDEQAHIVYKAGVPFTKDTMRYLDMDMVPASKDLRTM